MKDEKSFSYFQYFGCSQENPSCGGRRELDSLQIGWQERRGCVFEGGGLIPQYTLTNLQNKSRGLKNNLPGGNVGGRIKLLSKKIS